jgi:hypothetical protein
MDTVKPVSIWMLQHGNMVTPEREIKVNREILEQIGFRS